MSTPPSANLVLVHPAPLEQLVIPAALDGHAGTNRATGGIAQIAAANDFEAIRAWLARVADKRTTIDSYRKEAERLLLWSLVELGKPLSSLTTRTACAAGTSSPIRSRPPPGSPTPVRAAAASMRGATPAGGPFTARCRPPASGRRW